MHYPSRRVKFGSTAITTKDPNNTDSGVELSPTQFQKAETPIHNHSPRPPSPRTERTGPRGKATISMDLYKREWSQKRLFSSLKIYIIYVLISNNQYHTLKILFVD